MSTLLTLDNVLRRIDYHTVAIVVETSLVPGWLCSSLPILLGLFLQDGR